METEKPSDIVRKFGPDVLTLIESALDNGLNKQFAADAVEKLGPMLLQVLAENLRKKN